MASACSEYRVSPVNAARRRRATAATELADGRAASSRSLGRVMSVWASWPVVNSAPCTSSQKSSSMASAVARASAVHLAWPDASASLVKASTTAA